jgi:diguanylate cyclase (GGDEF)-like protein
MLNQTPQLRAATARQAINHGMLKDLRWLYLVSIVPTLTDLVERGGFPNSSRGWITEAVAGMVLLVLVQCVRYQYGVALTSARRDALTGLWNRRIFDEAIEDECTRSRRSGQPLSLLFLDANGFKQINDRFGHAEGDRALQDLAAAIRAAIRLHVDRAFRVGGDEFALILPDSTCAQAERVVGRIRAVCAVGALRRTTANLRFSCGIVQLRQQESAMELLQRADAAMYRQKKRGVPSEQRRRSEAQP